MIFYDCQPTLENAKTFENKTEQKKTIKTNWINVSENGAKLRAMKIVFRIKLTIRKRINTPT